MHTLTELVPVAALALALGLPSGLKTINALVPTAPVNADTVWVSASGENGNYTKIADAIDRVNRHGVVRVRPGVYREPTIVVLKPLTIDADPNAVIDGEGQRDLMVVNADSVTVRGLTFRNTGVSLTTDRSALRVMEAGGCLIENNRFEATLFAVYMQRASSCLVRHNVLHGIEGSQTLTGNGLHSWASRNLVFEDNVIDGHRDGIYFEFTVGSVARRNVSTNSLRYGLHFMFSDSCSYEDNEFRDNESGVAVMYARYIHMANNRFLHNRGSAAYGLLLKEISDSEIRNNSFVDNSVAMHLDGSSRNQVTDNDFVRNGWAVRILADAQDNMLERNAFQGNLFDVGTNSRMSYTSTFRNNWWDRYRGYDLDRDGIGDVPHSPVRLFSILVEQSPPAMVLVRSLLVDLLDIAERVVPTLTPAALRDESPLMRAPRKLP